MSSAAPGTSSTLVVTGPGDPPDPPADDAAGSSKHGALLVWVASFVATATGLLLNQRSLFTTRIVEVGDAAANSLLVNDAKDLDLLVGHYSRVGFNHPGPGVLYLQAAGEGLLHDLLGVVPAPYNGQVVAVLLLQAAVVAAVATVLSSWLPPRSTRWRGASAAVAAAGLATALVWYGEHQHAMTSTWIPFVVVPPFLLLVVASASVASGRSQHLWVLAAVSGLLVHAHTEFALFAPALTGAAVLAWAVTERLGPRALWQRCPRHWLVALGVMGLFVLPLALNTFLNWPGEIPKYLEYSGASAGAEPTLRDALHYARQFWAPDSAVARFVPLAITALAVAAAATAPRGARRPLLALTGAAVLAEALFVLYALVGIDDLAWEYVGYFSWSVPLALLLVVTTSAVLRLVERRPLAVAVLAASAVASLVALDRPGYALRPEGLDAVPSVADEVERRVGGRTAVLDVENTIPAFIDASGVLLELERRGRAVCVVNEEFRVQLTAERACTDQEAAGGVRLLVRAPGGAPPTFPGAVAAWTVAPS